MSEGPPEAIPEAHPASTSEPSPEPGLDLRTTAFVVAVSAGVAFLLAVASTFHVGLPFPSNHDEYAYLLGAETFAEGRLTNPTPPHWQHFERFHVLLEPSYFSKYPPGQSLLLALGIVLGHPIVGVWLGVAALAGAVGWLLVPLAGPRWALAGGLLVAIQYGLPNYWSVSYWGGSVAAVGGALVFGALPRLLRGLPGPAAPLLGLGLVLLALSRPLEGLVFALGCGLVLLVVRLRRAPEDRLRRAEHRLTRRLALGALPVVAVGALGLALHNRAVTGDPFQLPYQAYNEQVPSVPQFLWMDPGEPAEFRHDVFRRFQEHYRARFASLQSFDALLRQNLTRLRTFLHFYVGWALSVPLVLALLWALPRAPFDLRRAADRPRAPGAAARAWVGAVVALCGLQALLVFTYQGFHPHYVACLVGPLTFLFVAGTAAAARALARRTGRGRSVLFATVAVLLLATAAERLFVTGGFLVGSRPAAQVQMGLQQQLESRGGNHLVLVRLLPHSGLFDEWIHNGPDIPSQRVIWAHDLGPAENRELVETFGERTVWSLTVGADPRAARLVKLREPRAAR